MGSRRTDPLPGLPKGIRPYDWALRQLRVPAAHRVTKGSKEIAVAVIDLGYRHHPDLDGHLWRNPNPARGGLHGWDCFDDDASLEYRGPGEDASAYYRGHHAFVAGEVAAVAPRCPVMIVRVGYGNPDSWPKGIRWAVDHGARVLVIPHGYIAGEAAHGVPLFYRGTDFAYPFDNPEYREALDYAYDRGCLVTRGTADNRGRRVLSAMVGIDAVVAVGSANRRDEPANICCSADYVEIGTPGGQRRTDDPKDRIWGCGGDRNYIPFEGGCMASGFAGSVAGLIWSRFPALSNAQVRQILRNTARPARGVTPDADGWEPKLGYGIADAGKAVSLREGQLCRDVRLVPSTVRISRGREGLRVDARLENRGAFDSERTAVVAYNGDPVRPVDPSGSFGKPSESLLTKQIGHAIVRVRGLHAGPVRVPLVEPPKGAIWFETFSLDRHDAGRVHRARVASGG